MQIFKGGINIEEKKDYIKNIVHYLSITGHHIDSDDLYRLCLHLIDSNFEVEFSSDDIKEINDFIFFNDYNSVFNILSNKKEILMEVKKDFIHSNVDNLFYFVMNNAFETKWNENISWEEFLAKLTDYEKIAVLFWKLDSQIKNKGIEQWDSIGYSENMGYLVDFINESTYSKKEEFLEIFGNFAIIKDSIDALDKRDSWYIQDKKTRLDTLKDCDKQYYQIRDSWISYLEDYLIANIPADYLDLVKKYNVSNVNI